MFLSRKGTRSRPNVKIPKYYHAPYDHPLKLVESPESTIVREPHTHQADPLLQVDEIKAEPLDLEDDVIEIEDNAVEFSDHDVPLQEEEIIGNYDSPIVNINDSDSTTGNKDESDGFKKINLVQQPIIMDVHSITEKEPEILKIVDLAELKETSGGFEGRNNDMEVDKTNEDPLNFSNVEHGTDRITIASVESVADETNVGITIASVETVVENPENIEKIEEIVVQTSESLNYKVQVPEINVEESLRIEKSMARADSLAETEEVVLNVDGDHKEADTQIIKDTNEEMAENEENTLKDSGNEETDTQISEDVDKERKAGMEESMSKERSADTQISEVTNEKEKTERRGDKVHCESENVDQTESVTLENEEDDCTKLGFHIAKVACEQIAENEERKNDKKRLSNEESIENHEEESVTSEVSGPTESQDDRNSVEEVERPSDTVANVTLSEETRIMADSLEELLEM
ncbi:hypothetical protein NQ317_017802 [Molorchus minor]|uniref:Uncharacterized protein n=1 Tax=Molorchus minor TaxID=1323400 RepID=A0ABQ9K0L4_9CUCU|nr:hypothetical protein NQ317_017802 [Molorchus minor]